MAVRLPTAQPSLAHGVLGRAVGEARRRAADERGASAIDMAIVFPITLFLIFGIIQFGVSITLSSRAGLLFLARALARRAD